MSKDKQLDHDEKIRQMLYFIDFSGITLSEDDKPKLMETAFKSVNILRGQDYLKAHPDLDKRTKEAIKKEAVFIGMTDEQVMASMGAPYEINTTVSKHGTSEQWIYLGNRVLYFENGLLTSWQYSK